MSDSDLRRFFCDVSHCAGRLTKREMETLVETKMLEVEQAQMSAVAQARLGSLRAELGLRAPPMLNAPGDS